MLLLMIWIDRFSFTSLDWHRYGQFIHYFHWSCSSLVSTYNGEVVMHLSGRIKPWHFRITTAMAKPQPPLTPSQPFGIHDLNVWRVGLHVRRLLVGCATTWLQQKQHGTQQSIYAIFQPWSNNHPYITRSTK